MIELKNLVKRYGEHLAVDHLNLTIEDGRIYGFLGPNGAGKSTTMNLMTGYLGPTEGQILVDGHDILEEPEEAKRSIGYLPELPPLYPEMTVEEYLDFCVRLKQVPRAGQAEQKRRAMARVQIEHVAGRLIRNLSKGYRQRVGLAQALLGEPKTLILDEPTVGLDPKQIIEIRQLIRELGREHTVILSSHILSEVQAVCDQILILHHGRLLASDTPEHLEETLRGTAQLEITAKCPAAQAREILVRVDGVRVERSQDNPDGTSAATLDLTGGQAAREAVFFAFARAEVPLLEMHANSASLEEVFLEMTSDEPAAAEAAGREEETK